MWQSSLKASRKPVPRKAAWLLLGLAIFCSTVILLRPLGRSHDRKIPHVEDAACRDGECTVTLPGNLPRRHIEKCITGAPCRSIKLEREVSSAWSLAGWVRVDTSLDDVFETTAISFGPASLKFTAPAVPYVSWEAAWPGVKRRFEHKPALRGHCGDLSISVSKTASFEDALRLCAQTPGCTVVTRSANDLSTHMCKTAYSIEAYDPAWASAVLKDAPPMNAYSGAVSVNTWNLFALTYEAGELSFYVNGFLRQRLEVNPGPASQWIDLRWSPRWFEKEFPGQIGNFRFWSRRLLPNEVAFSMRAALPGRDLMVDVTPSAQWTGPPPIRSGWTSPSLPSQPTDCAAAVVVPVLDGRGTHLPTTALHLQHHAGGSCRAKVFVVACAPKLLTEADFGGLRDVVLLQATAKMPWDGCVRYGLEQVLAREPRLGFVGLAGESLLPMDGWLAGLVLDLQTHTNAAAAFPKVLFVDGSIKTAGVQYQQAYVEHLGGQVVRPVELYTGYPWNYGPAMRSKEVPAASCAAWLMRAADVRQALEAGAFSSSLGADLACPDMVLRLQQRGGAGRGALLSPASVLLDTSTRKQQENPAALKAFHAVWGPQLSARQAAGLALNSTVTWVMHCGGSMGIEAFNLVQYVEGRLKLRAQIQRGAPWCEHVDVLAGTPAAFSERVTRLRHLTEFLPSDIMIHHKDYRQLAAWPWPPNNSSAYLIGRYMWEVDRVHRQWGEQIRRELDEVWVPSHWHADSLRQQGIRADKVTVIPEALDSHLYDPAIWEPVTLPRQRRLTFLSVFKLEDRKGWQVLLAGYLKAFHGVPDTSLYIHTVSYPGLSYRRDLIYDTMNSYLRSSGDPYLESVSLYPEPTKGAPHVYVMGQHLTQLEMIRIYSSVDVFVVPSRGEGWGLPYMEAMSLGRPVIATDWSGMTEFIKPQFAFLLNYTIQPVKTTDRWFQGAKWAEPSLEGLITAFKAAYNTPQLQAMGRRARKEVVERYDNEVVGAQIVSRLQEIAKLRASRTVQPVQQLDMSKDQVPVDIHMCALTPKASVRVRSITGPIKLAVVSTAPPRRCGIATFNTALLNSLKPLLPQGSTVEVFPLIWDIEMPKSVEPTEPHTIRQSNFGDYVNAAKYINEEGFHAVLVQYEFGIWGGTYGSFAVCFARMLEVPLVSIIHTLSDNLYDEHHYMLQHLSAASTAVVVMSEASRNKLGAYHGIPSNNVYVLPHGAPVMADMNPSRAKAALNLTGRTVLMTNGLMHPGKGIDLALGALPEIVKEFPTVVYLIVGEPHPDCGKICDDYYQQLLRTAADPRIKNNVRFVRRFLEDRELLQYVQAADIYVLPYKDRITTNSGTLTMALAAGKAVVSTPFEHAASALVGRGRLVEFDSTPSLQEGLLEVLRDEDLQARFRKAAREYAAQMDWGSVAAGYLSLLRNITAGGV